MYYTEKFESEIQVEYYLKNYIDIECFLEKCKECPNYGKVWTCPPFDFDVKEYWKNYDSLHIYGVKIIFDEDIRKKTLSLQEQDKVLNEVVEVEKRKLSDFLWKKEIDFPGSISLSSGACVFCKNSCLRQKGKKCCYPEKLRYSIESLGGNVGLTVSRLLGIELEWMEEGKLPSYFVLVGGLLKK